MHSLFLEMLFLLNLCLFLYINVYVLFLFNVYDIKYVKCITVNILCLFHHHIWLQLAIPYDNMRYSLELKIYGEHDTFFLFSKM